MESAPTHTSQKCRSLAKVELPWVHHSYVGAGMTSVAQPLDRTYMRAYKSILRKRVAKHFVDLNIANNKNFAVKKGLAANRTLLPRWIEATVEELVQSPDVHALGWKHSNAASFEKLLDATKAEHAKGRLWWERLTGC
eukprot:3497250-Amphidinium_carterae.1